jgi:hypothetical protein
LGSTTVGIPLLSGWEILSIQAITHKKGRPTPRLKADHFIFLFAAMLQQGIHSLL